MKYITCPCIAVTGADGVSFLRTFTLYRLPDNVVLDKDALSPSLALAPSLCIDPKAVAEQSNEVNAVVNSLLRDRFTNDAAGARLLSWLSDIPAGSPPVHERNNVSGVDTTWWVGLKNKTGDLVKYRHFEYLPDGYADNKEKRWPLIIKLHGWGAGEPYTKGREVEIGKELLIQRARKEFPCIVSAPLCFNGEYWTPALLNALLDDLLATYRIDAERVYLVGISAGGYGAFATAMQYPARFAAIVPICGRGDVADIAQLQHMPVWAFHGDQDHVVLMESSQKMIDVLKAIGGEAKLTIYPGADHFIGERVYAEPELYSWLFQHTRKQ